MTPDEPIHVLFCSPDSHFADLIGRAMGAGFDVRVNNHLVPDAARSEQGWWDVALVDSRHAENGASVDAVLGFMDEIKQVNPPPPIIVMMGDEDRVLTRKLIESGAYDTLTSPPDIAELRLVIRRAYKFHESERELFLWRARERLRGGLFEMVSTSESMQAVFSLAQKVAPCDASVLITGETGTGKGLLARAMHRLSHRARGPFVAFSCANLPETLVEDELFGHEKGAFTGAIAPRFGRFEAADQGTLFLDEVGDLPLSLQAKFLRVLQDRTFERLGSNVSQTANVRLICATHRDLQQMVKEGRFREDLYYRLNVVLIRLPALREQRDGIPLLAYHFLSRFAEQYGKTTKRISSLAMHALEEYPWPGNIRELENVVQRAVVLADDSTIEVWDLPSSLCNGFEQRRAVLSFEEEVRDFKRRLLVRTLRECSGNKAETARVLGLARGHLHRLINQLQIGPEAAASEPGLAEEALTGARPN
jgi:two-component system response regulator HydG